MKKILIGFLTLSVLFSCTNSGENNQSASDQPAEINVYTHRHYESDQELFKLFEEQTGIRVNVTNASADELIQKMSMEGQHSPADVLITVDAGRLERAKALDLLQAIESEVLNETIPAHLRDPDHQWFALTKRARVIVYDKDRVQPEQLSTYEDLATDKWRGKLLTRSSENIYNQSLMASMVVHLGEEGAKNWAEGIVQNFARSPKGSDRDQVKAVVGGEGDIAIVNSYYLGQLIHSSDPEEVRVGQQVGIFFPNQDDRGTHINISGAGVAKHAPHKKNAIRFIEFLISEEAQEIFARSNYEYPVNAKVAPAELLLQWGTFKEDTLNLAELGQNNKTAVILLDQANWK